jgi:hypothetical protein
VNRPIQESNISKTFSNVCIHTKNIFTLLDTPKNEESYKRLSKHLDNCVICAKEFEVFKLKNNAAQVFIPKIQMDRDLRQSYDREVVELFKVMNLNDHENFKKNMKKSFVFVDRMGIEFVKNLSSKSMIKSYFVAGIVFVCLKFFL